MRRVVLLVLLAAGVATPALGHGEYGPLAPGDVLRAWRPDIALTLLLLAAAQGYAIARARLHRRLGRTVIPLRWAAATWAGFGVLWIALVSPLEAVTGTLLTAHMIQHVILIAAAPPLLLVGRPGVAIGALLPAPVWRAFARLGLARLGAAVGRPVPAALLHGAAMWVWHAPPLFDAAMTSEPLHQLEHACFFLTALLFWSAVFRAVRSPSRRIEGAAAIVVTLIQGGLLGALLTLAGRPLYGHGDAALAWGLTPLADQQLAGLVMWVPAGAVYLLAGMVIAMRFIGSGPEPSRAAHRR